jgi:serine phosphatase RsbU (regulator of sigma subunit)
LSTPTPLASVRSVDSDKAARALFALLELSKDLSSVVDLDQLLTVIVERSSSVVEAERTSIFIYDEANERLWAKVTQGLENHRIELPVGKGVVGDVARSRLMANIPDAYEDPRFNRETDRRTGYVTRSILCAPVLDSKGRLLAVLQSMNKVGGGRFDSHDETLMNALAAHVAVAIERAQATEVQLDNQRLEESLRLANEIQLRMLPRGKATTPEDAPFALHAHLRPARHVGGDLYDFFWTDDFLYFCIGDVTGKGIGSALVMAVTRTLFRAHATFQHDPAELMAAVSARVYEQTDPAMFVTAFCGFLDLKTGRVRYTNAGHDRPLVLSPGHPARRLESKSGLPLGVLPKFNYTVQELTLGVGDVLFLYTDGVTEATNAAEQMLTLDRVTEILTARKGSAPAQIVSDMIEHVDQFAGGTPQADDITMLCVQYRGKSAKFKRELAELERVFEFVGSFANDPSLNFAVEEIFVNCIDHNPDGKGDIEVRAARDGNDLSIAIIDPDGKPFDSDIQVDVNAALQDREPGGLGLFLTRKMMDRVEHTHEAGVGTITIYKKVE